MIKYINEILSEFPTPRNGKTQIENLADYFHAKKTNHKHEASKEVQIAHQTGTQFEETYEELTQEEQKIFDLHLMIKRLGQSENTTIETLVERHQSLTINN